MRTKWVTLVLAVVVAATLAVGWTAKPAHADSTFSHPGYIQNCDKLWEAFAVGPNGELYHSWQTSPVSWSAWHPLGGYLIYSRIALFKNVTCHLEVIGVGGDGAMWHIWQTNAGSGPWSNWASLHGGYFTGGPVRSAFTSYGGDIVWGWINGGATYVCDWQENAGGGPWSGWHPASVCPAAYNV